MFFQGGLIGSACDWALYTSSPLRAFEHALGIQATFGLWDPLGFTTDGNVVSFKRHRSVEVKLSHICMMSAIGYIQPEFTGKWPGFLSPPAALEFCSHDGESDYNFQKEFTLHLVLHLRGDVQFVGKTSSGSLKL